MLVVVVQFVNYILMNLRINLTQKDERTGKKTTLVTIKLACLLHFEESAPLTRVIFLFVSKLKLTEEERWC